MRADIPSINRMLAMLLPKIFPIAISVLPFADAKILTMNSGADVPKETIVNPITMGEIFRLFAIEEAPSTRRPAPFIRSTNPIIKRK